MTSPNSLFQIQFPFESNSKNTRGYGLPLSCSEFIRLYHPSTQSYVRANTEFQAPLSHLAEISTHPEPDDTLNNWQVMCVTQSPGTAITKDTVFNLLNQRHSQYLSLNKQNKFTQTNCRGCPIQNHFEVSGTRSANGDSLWTIGDGFFIPENKDRIVYDYNDLSKDVKIIDEKTGKVKAIKTNEKHDEL